MLQRLDLEHLAERAVDELSGGERQRAVLARAVAQEAPVLLLDEPTTSLDIGHQLEVLELVDELRRERSVTVVSSFHDLAVVGQFADAVALVVAGAVVAHGPPGGGPDRRAHRPPLRGRRRRRRGGGRHQHGRQTTPGRGARDWEDARTWRPSMTDVAEPVDLETYHPMEPAMQQCPFPGYAALRNESPVYHHAGTGMYFVSRLDTINTVLRDPETFSSMAANVGTVDQDPAVMEEDPPHQRRGLAPGRDDAQHRPARCSTPATASRSAWPSRPGASPSRRTPSAASSTS